MSAEAVPLPPDLHRNLGFVPLERIHAHPALGGATEEDLNNNPAGESALWELVDGVLVEKPVGYYESFLAGVLIQLLNNYLQENELGIVLGEGEMLRLAPGLVRLPDVSSISWDHFPGRKLPRSDVANVAPDLAVEIMSEGNTPHELERILQE